MFIQTEETPNPSTFKFLPGRTVMNEGTVFYRSAEEATDSDLALKLFDIEGVEGVFFGADFITITKENDQQWTVLKPILLSAIMDFYSNNENAVNKKESLSEKSEEKDTAVVKQIKELIDTRVRPAVAMDGGDIVYQDFKEGVVYLHMQGACAGCPSSTATLKMGIENMLKHYIPEVKEVRPTDE